MIAKEMKDYAALIASSDFIPTSENLTKVIGHLSPRDFNAVIEHAAAICRIDIANLYTKHAALKNLRDLARASGIPEGEKVIPWLKARGLIKRVRGRWSIVKTGPVEVSS
jgi:hypothetical protein